MSDAALNLILGIAIVMVIAGVVLEGAEYVEEIREKGWQLDNPWKIAAKLGFAVLVIGLAVEGYSSTVIHDRDSGRITDEQLIIDGENKDIRRAQDALKLAAIHLTDRQVNMDTMAFLAGSTLGPYAGQKLVIEYVENDDEAERLAENLADVLSSNLTGYWNVQLKPFVRPPQAALQVREPIPPGIFGPFFKNASTPPQAAGALDNILMANNFCLHQVNFVDWADPDPNTLTLLISHKDRTSKEGCL